MFNTFLITLFLYSLKYRRPHTKRAYIVGGLHYTNVVRRVYRHNFWIKVDIYCRSLL